MSKQLQRRIAIGALITIVVVVTGALAIQRVTTTTKPCPASTTPSSTPPASLVSAEDYLEQGNYHYEQGNCEQAIQDYTQAIELNPNLAEAYNNRAYTYMTLEDYAKALPDLDQAIELRPDYMNALMNRGDIYNYYYEIDYDRAVADYDRVIELGGQSTTSVCGHRLLALNHGWNIGVIMQVYVQGAVEAGCTQTEDPG